MGIRRRGLWPVPVVNTCQNVLGEGPVDRDGDSTDKGAADAPALAGEAKNRQPQARDHDKGFPPGFGSGGLPPR
jgi:hypothetical protein